MKYTNLKNHLFRNLSMLKIIRFVFIIPSLWEVAAKKYLEKSKIARVNTKLTKSQLEDKETTFINNFYQQTLLI